MIKDIAFSVYAVTDMARARAFYEGVLGLKPSADFPTADSHWVEYNIGSGTLSIGSSPNWKPSEDGVVVALEVDNFDEMIGELKSKEIPFRLEPQSFPSCHMAVICDPDKNRIMIHQIKAK